MRHLLTLAFLLLSLSTSFLLAQGVISGTVYDKATGETVIGASIVETVSGKVTITDFDGKYTMELPAGTYTLEFSYIGYPNLSVENVEVKDNEITYQDVTMSDEEGVDLDLGVTVTAQRVTNSEVGVLMLRKESIVVADNIGAQEMSRYGASDAGGALKKVTGTSVEGGKYIYVRGLGDRYSLVQLNGLTIPSTDPYRNSAQLDLIPTNLIDNISTAKTSSPDQPGNFTGGNVNIVTKKFPELETFKISISGGFNAQSNLIDNFLTQGSIGKDYLGFDNTRAIPEQLTNPETRQLLNASSSRAARFGNAEAANALEVGSTSILRPVIPNQANSFLDHGIAISYGNRFDFEKSRLGLIATASFKQDYQHLQDFEVANFDIGNPQDDTLQLLNRFKASESVINPTISGLVGLTYRIGQNNEFGALAMYNHTAETVSSQLHGERDVIRYPIQLEAFGMSHTEQELRNMQINGEHNFPNANNLKIEWKGSLVNSSQVEPQTRFFEYGVNLETRTYIFGGTDLFPPYLFWRDLQDEQYIGKLDVTLPLGATGSSIKVGGLYSAKDRVSAQDEFRFGRGAAATDLNEVGGDLNRLFSDEYIGIVGERPNGRFDVGWYVTDNTDNADSYSGSEKIGAGYAMLTLQATDKLKVVGGARLESTDIYVTSLDTSIEAGQIDTLDILPSVNLIYEVVEDFNIRASYSKTIARPNLREISPFTILEPSTNIRESGNPGLTRTSIDNFDVRFEYFPGGSEVIALSAYYKKFKDPIARAQLAAANVTVFQPQNVEDGELFGLELELRKRLDFLSEKLSNFTFVSNASFITSSIATNDESDSEFAILKRNFVGQSDYIVNAALNYVHPDLGWDVALAVNAIGDRVVNIGSPGGLRRDQVARARTQLDFIGSKRINNKLKVSMAIKNILDDPYRVSSYFNNKEFVNETFKRGLDFRFGVSYIL